MLKWGRESACTTTAPSCPLSAAGWRRCFELGRRRRPPRGPPHAPGGRRQPGRNRQGEERRGEKGLPWALWKGRRRQAGRSKCPVEWRRVVVREAAPEPL